MNDLHIYYLFKLMCIRNRVYCREKFTLYSKPMALYFFLYIDLTEQIEIIKSNSAQLAQKGT